MTILLRSKNQSLIFKIYQQNNYRNVGTSYEMSSSMLNQMHRLQDVGSISVRQAINKYMCNISLSNKNCWKCGENLRNIQIFCDKCNSLQQVNTFSNYFEIIGVEYSYNLNLSELSQKYRKLQSVLHPDKFGNKTKVCYHYFKKLVLP